MSLHPPQVLKQAEKLKSAFHAIELSLENTCYSSHTDTLSLTLKGQDTVVSLIVHKADEDLSIALTQALKACFHQYHADYASALHSINASFEEEHTL